ncbi:alkaline phosphatase family protein [Lacihabitans lacunae]|uniref:Ectonucleotide pyrophosphatase/phosphodiesterase n=1 Tax=Lacihabitans lacunae TaxID=1028214 RepID=A0ABV7YSS7_9BACT
MKHLFAIVLAFFFVEAVAQVPTYDEILKNEILSNSLENSKEGLKKPYVIIVSIDGFRYDYAEKFGAENILDIAKEGSSASRLIPSFPSKTFPNHYTLVTGLYPQNHGIVSNSFYDKTINDTYSIGKRESVENGSWYGGTPIWNLAQQQGLVAASYFWVGSEANINGLHPRYYYPYLKVSPIEYRVQRVKQWLELPEKIRPHMITMYYSDVDDKGHAFGPESEENKEAVLKIDKQIGELRAAIKASGLPITLIVTADHGMVEVNQNINVHDYITLEKGQFYSGPVAMIYTKNELEKETFFQALSKQNRFKVYKKEAVPNYLNYNHGDRIGDLVLVADAPDEIIYTEKEMYPKKPGGTHGYDPFEERKMSTIFYIEGPRIKKGFKLAATENIHVYPLIAEILGLKITEPIDGKLEAMSEVLIKEK